MARTGSFQIFKSDEKTRVNMYKHEILNKDISYKKLSSISEYAIWMVGIYLIPGMLRK